jgi:hypothetical protein
MSFVFCLKVLVQLANAEIIKLDVMIRVRTPDLTVVCEFNFNGLPLHIRQKKKLCLFIKVVNPLILDWTVGICTRVLLL